MRGLLVSCFLVDAKEGSDLGTELVSVGTAHDLRVDGKGHLRVTVADLRLDVGDVETARDGVRDVGAPERVRGYVRADWRVVALRP